MKSLVRFQRTQLIGGTNRRMEIDGFLILYLVTRPIFMQIQILKRSNWTSFYIVQKRRYTDFEALKLWNIRSGSKRFSILFSVSHQAESAIILAVWGLHLEAAAAATAVRAGAAAASSAHSCRCCCCRCCCSDFSCFSTAKGQIQYHTMSPTENKAMSEPRNSLIDVSELRKSCSSRLEGCESIGREKNCRISEESNLNETMLYLHSVYVWVECFYFTLKLPSTII